MRLAIVNLTGGGLSGGYRKYLQNLLPLLQKHPGIDDMSVFLPPDTETLFDTDKIQIVSWPSGYHKWSFSWIKNEIDKISPDIVFIPTARLVEFGSIPTVIMVRNMEPLTIPFGRNPFMEAIKNIGRTYSAKQACYKADRIIAVSEHVREFLVSQWHINLSHIGVVYHGVELLNGSNSLQIPDRLINLEHKKFIFTAGSIRPARGLEDIIRAMGQLYSNGLKYHLVIAGGIDPGMKKYQQKILRMALKFNISPQIIWAGLLSQNEMSWYYRHCSVFIMTSRTEACPNVVLEAMANGCICISTETPPMPEIFGDTALYYSLGNEETLANIIQTILSWDDHKRKAISEKTKLRASQFSWDVCTEKTVAELKLAIEHFAQRGKEKQ